MHVGPEAQLAWMGITACTGWFVSAHVESQQIHHENTHPDSKDLPHGVLAAIRFLVALAVAKLLVGAWVWRIATLILFGACIFAPGHRLYLNYLRRKNYPLESRTITITHLRKVGYDGILFFIRSEKWRFITLCVSELALASALWVQAHITN